ncbi:MAG: 3-keto-5-aminohexanoate cleavage protein [Rhodococcus sp. (in: high G+C Gram-positive bacteria)]
MKLKACINGPRTHSDHHAVPVTGEQIAAEAVAAARAGAEAIHVHPKTSDGTDSLDADRVTVAVDAAREAGIPVGVTTGAWSTPDLASRLEAVSSWRTLPDFASVNWHETGATEVAALLLDRGVAVEAGLWNAEAARSWLDSGLATQCLRALLEVQPGASLSVADELLALTAPVGIPLLLHGQNDTCWRTLGLAVENGLASRIGLEDTIVLPDGTPARGNFELVTAALTYWS